MHLINTNPMLASALQFAFDKATIEGKITVAALFIVSLFSWMVIVSKTLQFAKASRMTRRFFTAYRATRDPLELQRNGATFDGAPAYELYCAAVEELNHHLAAQSAVPGSERRISASAFESIRVTVEEAAIGEAQSLEKGMTVLSTAVAGGPFIGLLGTVWGVMETFAGIARVNTASLTAMAPGVAGALIATVIGLLVAIPAMFAYNFMVTRIRAFTQELDGFAIRFVTQIEHQYVYGGESAPAAKT
jgi:biopolymer transport protein TolQ